MLLLAVAADTKDNQLVSGNGKSILFGNQLLLLFDTIVGELFDLSTRCTDKMIMM